VFNDW
jgi:hypothetical protein